MALPDIFSPHPFNNSLYIHIPFCSSKCSYCDFYSETDVSESVKQQVIGQILKDVSFYFDSLQIVEIETVFIGGGTPSVLSDRAFVMLMKGLGERIPKNTVEWTIEANPETVRPQFLETAERFGCTRLSLGIQSFSDRLLSILNRRARQKDILRTVELIDKVWGRELSGDILTGIPSQTMEEAGRDLETLFSLGWNHFSAYSLTLEEGTLLHKTVSADDIRMLPKSFSEKLWMTAVNDFQGHGYRHYEISNFAKPGYESRHNLRYWHMEPYIGVGPGAVSTLPGKEGSIIRLQNTPSINEYISKKEILDKTRHENISAKEFLLENMMMGFRLQDGIKKETFLKRFGNPLDAVITELWEQWKTNGLALETDEAWILTQKGRYLLDSLLGDAAKALEKSGDIVIESWG